MCTGKLALLDLGNNSITAKGAFYVAEYIKRSKCLVWLNLYMNDIGDEVLLLYNNGARTSAFDCLNVSNDFRELRRLQML